MKNEILRKKPRVNLNIPAILRVNGAVSVYCCMKNASTDGFGVEVDTADFKKIQQMKIEKSELYWAPVPSMKAQPWQVNIRRAFGNGLGLELQKSKTSSMLLKVLRQLIHFHLK